MESVRSSETLSIYLPNHVRRHIPEERNNLRRDMNLKSVQKLAFRNRNSRGSTSKSAGIVTLSVYLLTSFRNNCIHVM
jgi:hypothetical protein